MGSLMAALVAALLIRVTDPTAGYAARAADRSGKPGAVLAGSLAAIFVTHTIAAVIGFLLGPHMTPNPKRLFVALALLVAASGAVWPGKALDPGEARRPFWNTAGRLTVGPAAVLAEGLLTAAVDLGWRLPELWSGDSLADARSAAQAGASYVSFGAMYPSPTKPQATIAPVDLLRQSAALGVARVAIGGITPDNAALLIEAGADYVASISSLFAAPDVRGAAQRFARLFPSSNP